MTRDPIQRPCRMAARPPLRLQVLYCRDGLRRAAAAVAAPLPLEMVAGVGVGAAEAKGHAHPRKRALPDLIGLLVGSGGARGPAHLYLY